MTLMKESLVDLYEKYQKAIRLIEEESRSDSLGEPYLSKCSGKQILLGMKTNVENLINSQSDDSIIQFRLTAILGFIHLYLGIISIEVEDNSTGEKYFTKCENIIKNYTLKPEFILISLRLYNQLGILHAEQDFEISKKYLDMAETLYNDFKSENITPMSIEEIFKGNENITSDVTRSIEQTYTLTLYYLAQVFGRLKDSLKSAVYCHKTLQRQYDHSDYEPIDWALNSATLSQFFMEKNAFTQARHHLAAGTVILSSYGRSLSDTNDSSETHLAAVDTYKRRYSDLSRCWVKYGLCLLTSSKDRLMSHTEDIDTDCKLSTDISKLVISSSVSSEDLLKLNFEGIDVSFYEKQITDKFILTVNDAKKVFLTTQNWITKAQEYYTLEEQASDFIEITQDYCQLYALVVFFEDNPDDHAKLHKRRIDLLERIISSVNEQYYIQYCRQIWYELGQTYEDILYIKLEKMRESEERPKPQLLTKINNLVDKSIFHYNNFVDSFKDKVSGSLPEKIVDEMEQSFLRARLHIAALYGRYITLDSSAQLKNTETQLENYKAVMDYCKTNTEAVKLIPSEFSMCKEMVELLPIKIAKQQGCI